MPIVVLVGMTVRNPSYLNVFREDPDGRKMAFAAIGCQAIGYLLIRKIVNIKV
jgi:Flp pilus assembly protein TadB